MKYYWAIIYLVLFPIVALSQHIFVDNDKGILNLAPGSTSSIAISISNPDSISKHYLINCLNSNPKIELFNTKKEITLVPFQKTVFILPIKITKDCISGKHQITVNFEDKTTKKTSTITIDIFVKADTTLLLKTLSENEYIKAGDTIYSTFSIKNIGNTLQQIVLFSKNGKIDSDSTISLKPFEEKTVTVVKSTKSKENQIIDMAIDLNVFRSNNKNEKLTAYNSVQVIPTNPIQLDAYKRIPLIASMNYISANQTSTKQQGWQGNIYINGNISDSLNDNFELRIQTKNPLKNNMYLQYEEYYARYSTPQLYIHLGDKVFQSSPLTEFFRFGRGVELQYTIGKSTIGGFYNKPRFFKNIKDEFNIDYKYSLNTKNSITLGYLQKYPSSKDSTVQNQIEKNAYLPYIIVRSSALKNTTIESEYSYSKSGEKTGSGFRFEGRTSFYKLYANLNYIYSSPNYSGYFQSTNTLNASLGFLVSSKINININHNQDARSFQRDTLYLAAPFRRNTQIGINYIYSKNGYLNVSNGYLKSQDRMTPSLFNYNESFIRFNINQQIGIFRIGLDNNLASTKNSITNTKGNSNFHQLNISFNTLNTNFSTFVSLSNTSRYEDTNTKYYFYGGRISKVFKTKTLFNIYYQNNYSPEEYFQDRNQFEANITQRINKNNAIEINARYMLQRGELGNKEFIFQAKYVANINIPIKKVLDYAELTGTITNSHNQSIEGLRIQLGNQLAITDKNGKYIFKNITPGEYYLDIDQRSLGLNDLPNQKLPKAITISNLGNTQDFVILEASKIKGKVQIINPNTIKNFNIDENRETPSVIIEISNGIEIYKKISAVNETFDFTHLKPGLWTIKTYHNTANNNLEIIKDQYEIELKPNQEYELTIELKSIQKQIKYQQQSIKIGYNGNK